MSGRTLPALLALLLASCATETGGYWPQWRGSLRDNISRESNLLQEWPPEGPPLLWSVEGVGAGIGSVAIAGGRVFVLGYHDDFEYVTALEEGTGRRLWAAPVGTTRRVIDNVLMRWLVQRTPALDGDRVYAFSSDAQLSCLDSATGRELWNKDYVDQLGGTRSTFGACDYPLVDGEKIICVVGGPRPAVVALDKHTGDPLWRSETSPGKSDSGYVGEWGATVLSDAGGVRQYIALLRNGLAGFRGTDGAVLWRYERVRTGSGFNYSHTPILLGDTVIATTGNSGGMAGLKLRPSGDGVAVEEKYYVPQQSFLFTQDSTVVLNNRLHGLRQGGQMVCLEGSTGKEVWRQTLKKRANASFTCAGDRLVMHGSDGVVTLFAVGPEGVIEKGAFTVTDQEVEAGASMPVIAGGRLYLRRENALFAYDLREGGAGKSRSPAPHLVLESPPRPTDAPRTGDPQAAFVPTPYDIVRRMLRLAKVGKDDVLCDLGSGDGRILIVAAEQGARAIGYEINPELVQVSRKMIETRGLKDRATVEERDMATADLSLVTVVAVYLPEPFLEKLKPRFATLRPGARVVSHQFKIPGFLPTRTVVAFSKETGRAHALHLYEVPFTEEGR